MKITSTPAEREERIALALEKIAKATHGLLRLEVSRDAAKEGGTSDQAAAKAAAVLKEMMA